MEEYENYNLNVTMHAHMDRLSLHILGAKQITIFLSN